MAVLPLLLAALGAAPVPAAWSSDGHKIVCEIAFQEMHANTRAKVRALISSDPEFQRFSDSCVWADEIRGRVNDGDPAFQRFRRFTNSHFVNFQRDADSISVAGCTRVVNNQREPCVIDAIRDFAQELKTATTVQARLEALKFLSHFVGDVHQPLHAGYGDDLGGNRERVRLSNGDSTNLHSVWDRFMIANAGKPWELYARELQLDINPIDRKAWSVVDPVLWARESYQLVEDDVYEDRAPAGSDGKLVVDQNYYVLNRLNAERRLKQAGVRLARIIEQALGTTP
jgi:hypothetical protein